MDFKKIEERWQEEWKKSPELYRAADESKKPKKYVLVEFPYPSGSGLHVGHAFSFTGGDVFARYWRMRGYNVLFPMGWDAFGLPTENFAIKMKKKPQIVTKENTDMFRSQMKKLAFSFDWSREVNTTDPDYYKWTQWIFVKLFEKGLAYKQEMPINWCPSCKIGLANEEVVDGKCERCHSEVSRRNISQWVVKITEYADRLIEGLGRTNFIEKVKAAQINWIGKSEGAKIRFKIQDSRVKNSELEVFTTRADTLYGATFMVISPEHDLVAGLVESNKEIKSYVEAARKKSDLERAELQKVKTGVDTGLKVINPVNGREIPLWVADYVLMGYGTGVVMGVPGHDQRDWDFAKKYGLEIVPVIENGEWDFEKGAMTSVDQGKMINSEMINGLPVKEAITKMNNWVEEKGVGKKTAMYHLRDWIFSRQHYWGEPIPMVYCEKDGWVPVPEDQLPVVLPEVEAYEPTDDGQSPLAKMTDWVRTTCPKCGGEARRETDTMPNWAGSDWYFVRYLDPKNKERLADMEKQKYWLPVDVYVGGDEHNTLHLLYSRFIYKFLYDLGVVPTDESYDRRMSHGVILGPDNQRMSKSRGNVIVPETVSDKYGVDVVRMYMMFMGPFEATMAWNENTLMGVKRFLERFERFVLANLPGEEASNREVQVIVNKLIKGVSEDLEGFGFNTAIAKMMEALNKLSEDKYLVSKNVIEKLLKLIAPFAPYLAEELWSKLGNTGSVHVQSWPEVETEYLIDEMITIIVSVNGKPRSRFELGREFVGNKDFVVGEAKKLEDMKKWLERKEIVREVYVPGKMVNLVVR